MNSLKMLLFNIFLPLLLLFLGAALSLSLDNPIPFILAVIATAIITSIAKNKRKKDFMKKINK